MHSVQSVLFKLNSLFVVFTFQIYINTSGQGRQEENRT